MVYKLRPLEISLDLDDRTYKLGGTVGLVVELKSRSDVNVREARVDLVCEEHYLEKSTISMEKPIFTRVGGGGMGGGMVRQTGTETVNKQVHKQQKNKYVHSRAVFLKDTLLTSGRTGRYEVRLEIKPEPPPHAEDAKALVMDPSRSWSFKWTLVTTIDVVRGRNPKRQRAVKVALE